MLKYHKKIKGDEKMKIKALIFSLIAVALLAFCSCNDPFFEPQSTDEPQETQQVPTDTSPEEGELSNSEVTTGKEYSNNY